MGEKTGLKFIILGRSSTGKSSLLRALKGEKIEKEESSKYTYYSDASVFETTILDKHVTIKVMDTGGRSPTWRRYKNYKDVHGVMITYNASSQRSLSSAINQASYLNNYLPQGNFPIIIVGTKYDITKDKDIDSNEATKLVKENKMEHRLVSAVTKEGINELLPSMIELVESMSDKIAEVHASIAKKIEEADIEMKKRLSESEAKDRDRDRNKTTVISTS